MSIPTVAHCLAGLERAHILVDTCFLIDASKSLEAHGARSPYAEVVKVLNAQHNTLVSIFPVSLEFFKGSDLLQERRTKKRYYDDLIQTTLPVDPAVVRNAETLTQLYRTAGKSLSPTDFLLGGTLMKYGLGSSFYLLTRDHGDFPLKIFNRDRVIVLAHEHAGVDAYGLFSYAPDKITAIEQQLLAIDKKHGEK